MVLGSFSPHLLRILGPPLGKNRWKVSRGPTVVFLLFRNNDTQPYSSLPSEAIFANSTGMLVVVFGLLVLYILLVSSWKRPEPGILSEGQVWGPGLPFQVRVGPGPEKGHLRQAWALPGSPLSNMVGNQMG